MKNLTYIEKIREDKNLSGLQKSIFIYALSCCDTDDQKENIQNLYNSSQDFRDKVHKKMKEEESPPNLSPEEVIYRRGFCHGVVAANNGVSLEDAQDWRHNGEEKSTPPGVPYPGDGWKRKQYAEIFKFEI